MESTGESRREREREGRGGEREGWSRREGERERERKGRRWVQRGVREGAGWDDERV